MKIVICLFILIVWCPRIFSQEINNEQLLDLMQSQRYREAAALIKSSFPVEITDPKIVARLAYCTYMAGNLPEAEKSYKLLLDRDSTSKPVLFNLAAINSKRGNLIQSSFYYEKLLKLDSTNFSVYKQLAMLAEQMHDKEKWFIYLEKANTLDPKEPDIAYDYCNLLKKKENYKKADSVIQSALEADTLNLLLIQGKMEISYKLKNYLLAAEMSKKAIKIGDSSAQTCNILAQCLYFMKQYQQCIETYNLLEEQELANETTFYYTALAYRKLNNISKSIEYFNKSINNGISDNITVYYHELAIDYENLKNYKKSISSYKKAAEFETKNIYNYNIARLYDAYLDDKINAKRYYKTYLKNYKAEESGKDFFAFSLKRVKEL